MTKEIENEIVPLVTAINNLPGVKTRQSCGGHVDRYSYILVSIDRTGEALNSICLISHALKRFKWKLVASTIGSVGEIWLEFFVLPVMLPAVKTIF